jgi:membrane complex biogenesis BtpA family protein
MASVLERALLDAQALVQCGYEAVIVENFGDLPFHRDRIPALSVAAMARIAGSIRERHPALLLGLNCLRNDAASAVAIAAAVEADFVRVNLHCGAAWSDQGLLQGDAAETLRARAAIRPQLMILADLRVKHAAPVAQRPLVEEALELRERGLADVLLMTGPATGSPANMDEFDELRAAADDIPLWVASGVDVGSAAAWSERADGAIVGSALMQEGHCGRPIDPRRAAELRERWMTVRTTDRAQAAAAAEKER